MSRITAVVADIGGTNTRVALTHGGKVRADTIRRFRNADHAGLSSVLAAFLEDTQVQVGAACVAMAGPVRDGVGRLTNLDWTVTRQGIAEATGAQTVAVLNDLQAQGHALWHLGPDSLQVLRPGQTADSHAASLVVGVGTGLNAALVYHTDGTTLVPPSESGHVSLPVQTQEDLALLEFLSGPHGLAGVEEALSGRGLQNLYHWHSTQAGAPQHKDAAQIMAACAESSDPQARAAVQSFVTLLGRIIGNLALIQLPFGGVYLCGGVARHVAPYFDSMGFEAAFLDKGRFSDFLKQFPVYLVTDDYAALTGSASHLMELIPSGD